MRIIELLQLRAHTVYYLVRSHPAVFYVTEGRCGVLVNTPRFSVSLMGSLSSLAPPRFAFYPSRFGARDAQAWRRAGVTTIAYGMEARAIGGTDIVLDASYRLSRSVDFLPMSGRTEATCALRCKGRPAAVFFGPALERGPSGWPELVPREDDHSFENRLLGALALKELKFDYAFTDDFDPRESRYGPGAAAAIRARLEAALGP